MILIQIISLLITIFFCLHFISSTWFFIIVSCNAMLTMKSTTHFHFYHSYESLYSLLQASFYRIFFEAPVEGFFIVCHTSSIFSILISLTINATTDNDYQLNHLFIYSMLQCYYCYLFYPLHVYSTYSAGYTTTWF